MKHLYVHIPFCRSRCGYCDFASEPVGPHLPTGRVDAYLEALRAELLARGQALQRPLETIYLGGGTPTALGRQALLDLVLDLAALLELDGGGDEPAPPPEFTVEANPGTLDAALLGGLRAAGVTRLSLGVQSFSPGLRAALGRRVSQSEVEASLAALSAVGWTEWNLDLVFGIPGQTWPEAAADIDEAVAAAPTHVSLYDLTYTPAFASRVARTQGPDARSRAEAFAEAHLSDAVRRLEAAGYRRYEVSNFALPGHECRHNLAYWHGEDYLGVGAAAVSTAAMSAGAGAVAWDVAGFGVVAAAAPAERRTNPRSVASYLAGEPPEIEQIDAFTKLWERAMLGLRTTEGVEEEAVQSVLDQAGLEVLLEQGCLQRCCGKLRLNTGFLDICNSVLATLLMTPDGG
jgi:oxygen-independent coproporphyrinogen-3 oxidase